MRMGDGGRCAEWFPVFDVSNMSHMDAKTCQKDL
jgi:hypothetical protein